MTAKVWMPESEMQKDLFEDQGSFMPMKLRYFDLPHMFTHTPIGFKLIDALHDCKSVELFALGSVQVLIDT